jgi:hypothetical protein
MELAEPSLGVLIWCSAGNGGGLHYVGVGRVSL